MAVERSTFKRECVPRGDHPEEHIAHFQQMDEQPEGAEIEEEDNDLCENWEIDLNDLNDLSDFPIEESYTDDGLEHVLGLLGRLHFILSKPVRPMLKAFKESELIIRIIAIFCAGTEAEILYACCLIFDSYLFQFGTHPSICEFVVFMKLESLIYSPEFMLARSSRNTLCTWAGDPGFFHALPLQDWDNLVTELLSDRSGQNFDLNSPLSAALDHSMALSLIGTIARHQVLGESMAIRYLESCLKVVQHPDLDLEDLHETLMSVKNLLNVLNIDILRKIAPLCTDIFTVALREITRYLVYASETDLVLDIFRIILRAGVGEDVIFGQASRQAMLSVLSENGESSRFRSILDFLCFWIEEGNHQVNDDFIVPALQMAEMGSLAEQRSALRFLRLSGREYTLREVG
jgi:hypothetical protein